MFKYRAYILVIIACLSLVAGKAQNLVPNPSFENFTSCPGVAEFSKLIPWCGLAGGEDTYNVCNSSQGVGGFGVPYTFFGFQYPRTGNGCVSVSVIRIGAVTQDNREYIHVPLTKPLVAGKSYCGSMYLNLYNESKYTTDKIGMYFSTTSYACSQAFPLPQYIAPLNVIPQVSNAPGSFITDTLNWTEVSGAFTAVGNEQYLTIGNFVNDAATNTVVVNPTSAYTVTYFLIDDVSLEEIIPAQAIKDTSMCSGDSILLASPSPTEFAEYGWQPATGLSCTNCASPKASPQSTVTYTLTKKQCKATTSARVTLTVKTDCDVKAQLEIPNVFTPNEDGRNDTFKILLPPGSVLKEFAVYNRWGNIIKNTEALPQQSVILWDGRTTAGEACPAGVYYYVLTYANAEGEVQKRNGYITLFN